MQAEVFHGLRLWLANIIYSIGKKYLFFAVLMFKYRFLILLFDFNY